jgi:hypothetical protein
MAAALLQDREMDKVLNMKSLWCGLSLAIATASVSWCPPAEAQAAPPSVIRMPSTPATSTQDAALPKGTPVQISFAPPLGVPIRYRAIETKMRNGRPSTNIVELVVRFERSDEAYVMEGRVEMPGLAPRLAADPMVRIALRPIRFRLDREGGFIGIEREDDYWAGLEPIIDQMVNDPSDPPEASKLIRGMFRKMREMPPGDRAVMVGRKFVPITAYANVDLSVGETVETPPEVAEIPLPLANAKLKRSFAVTLAGATSTSVRIEMETRFDKDDMARFMRELVNLAPRDKRPTELPEMPELHQSLVHVVSRDTGLILSSTETSRAGDDPKAPAVKIVTLERLKP